MIKYVKQILKDILTPEQRTRLKRIKRDLLIIFKGDKKKTTLSDIEDILINKLNLASGDRVFVTSGFKNLNAQFSPTELILLLQKIVTNNGTIMMPYYPPINSSEFAKRGEVFDMGSTKSGMGVLTNVFAKMPDVHMSVHPTKAVCVWGKDAELISREHEISTTPFYWDSPYGKFLKLGCKTIGLGVGNNPIFHSIEDAVFIPSIKYYEPQKYHLKVIKRDNNEVYVDTYVHDSRILSKCISSLSYIKNLRCNSYIYIKLGFSFVYSINNLELYNHIKKIVDEGGEKSKLRQIS